MNAGHETGQSRVAQFLFGTPFLLAGAYFILAGIGVLPMPGKALVPLWIITCAGLVFFIPGFTLVLSALKAGRKAASVPGTTRVIRANEGRSGVLGAWGAALFSSALVAGFWGAILSDAPSSGNMPDWMVVAIIGFFTLVAAALVVVASYLTISMLRFGEAQLVLTPAPVQVGGALKGYVELPGGNLPAHVNVRLQCFRFAAHANSAGSEKAAFLPSLKSAWEDLKVVPVTVMAGKSRIAVNIPIPEGLAASHMPAESTNSWVVPGQARVYCQWFLCVSADVPGVDLKRTFGVEVIPGQPNENALAAEPELVGREEPERVAAATKVALAELTAGRAPAAVAGRLESFGLTDAVVSQVLNDIGRDTSQPCASSVRAYLANLARIQAEVNSGQLFLLDRARGPGQPKNSKASTIPAVPIPGSGVPVLLADESALCRGKWIIGGFLMVWGGLFGGIPAVIGIGDPTQRNGGLFVFFLIGCAAFCGGLWIMSRRHSIWLLPGQGRLEERTGRFRADQVQHHDQSGFDRVVTAKSVSRSSKGRTTVTFHVALAKGAAREEGSLALGDYSEFDVARAAAMQLAGRLSLPLYDVTIDPRAKPVTVAAPAMEKFNATGPQPDWWRQPSALVLVLANLVPIGGVLFAGWEVFPIMLLFWLENLVVGVITALKMIACGRGNIGEKIFTLPFFAFHYGMFCSVHGAFVFAMFAPKGEAMHGAGGLLPDPATILHVVQQQGLWIAVVALVASHGFSFVVNFLGKGVNRTAEVRKVMMAPYGRIVVLHVVILLGGFVVMSLDAPLFALLLLVILKVIMDVTAHIREHRRRAGATLAAGISGMEANP